MIPFVLENGIYKLVDINLIFKDLSNEDYSKVNDILSVNSLLTAKCGSSLNVVGKY